MYVIQGEAYCDLPKLVQSCTVIVMTVTPLINDAENVVGIADAVLEVGSPVHPEFPLDLLLAQSLLHRRSYQCIVGVRNGHCTVLEIVQIERRRWWWWSGGKSGRREERRKSS